MQHLVPFHNTSSKSLCHENIIASITGTFKDFYDLICRVPFQDLYVLLSSKLVKKNSKPEFSHLEGYINHGLFSRRELRMKDREILTTDFETW